MPCPFQSVRGFTTLEARDEYIRVHHKMNHHKTSNGVAVDADTSTSSLDSSSSSSSTTIPSHSKLNETEVPTSLEASMDITKPLYYWQLFSILGRDPIVDIMTRFYVSIFEDDDKEYAWFSQTFRDIASLDYHINAQAAYWIDSMGGGKLYPGGSRRINFHHSSSESLPVMTAPGAKRWMYFMRNSIRNQDFSEYNDPRIVPCLVDFLKVKMIAYAAHHNFEFDESDFVYEDYVVKNQ